MHIPQYDRARKCYLFCIRFFMPPDDRQEKHGIVHLHMVLQSVEQELVFLRQHSEQRQRQTSSVSRQYFAVVFVHLCRQDLRHFAKQDMIREMLTLSVSMR